MKSLVLSAALVLATATVAQAQYVTYYSNPVVSTSYYAEPVTSY